MLQNHVAWNSLNSHSSSVFSTLPHQLSHPSAKNSHRPATFGRGLSLLQLPTSWSSLSGTIGTAPKHLHLVNREFLESGKSDLLSARRCSASPCSAWHSEWHKGRGSEMIVEWTVRHLATFKAGGETGVWDALPWFPWEWRDWERQNDRNGHNAKMILQESS